MQSRNRQRDVKSLARAIAQSFFVGFIADFSEG